MKATIATHPLAHRDGIMTVLAIDPGPVESAFLVWGEDSLDASVLPNDVVLDRLVRGFRPWEKVAIEMVACYGMPVGKEVFETCLWIGRFIQRSIEPTTLVYRKDVKIHLCGSMRAKDGNIRQALIDKYGPPGTKKAPGRTYGISGHLWSALAIADYVLREEPITAV